MKKWVIICSLMTVVYLLVGASLHWLIFPEAEPKLDDRPSNGDQVRLPNGLTLSYRTTASETAGEFFETQWQARPGAGFSRFSYPSQQVTLILTVGSLEVVVDGVSQTLMSPAKLVIAPGGQHSWVTLGKANGLWRIEPAGMADFVFQQTDRAFQGVASELETQALTIVLVGAHGKHAPALVRAVNFLIAPTARLFGIRSYYPPPVK
ncbi:MAG: hypothetical protein JKY89_11980 [Immundisolibacteraceae bacterium]|nr:hypothetical protein [Immundisolibacteraceae bacterium]